MRYETEDERKSVCEGEKERGREGKDNRQWGNWQMAIAMIEEPSPKRMKGRGGKGEEGGGLSANR
jgi:hypothetical protein